MGGIIGLRVIPELGNIILEDLKPMQLQQFYARLQQEGNRQDGKEGALSARTALHHHRLIRKALQQAVKRQLLKTNPADATDAPRAKKTQMAFLTEEQAKELLKKAEPTQFYLPFLLAVTTGIRRAKLYGLRWSDIQAGNVVKVQKFISAKICFIFRY